MTRLEIYRLALIEGLTAKEAARKYNCCPRSLAKIKTRHKLPSLAFEYEKELQEQIARLNDLQLKSYWEALCLPKNKNTSKREKDAVSDEIVKRGL